MHEYFRHTPAICDCPSFGSILLLNQIYVTTMYRNRSTILLGFI